VERKKRILSTSFQPVFSMLYLFSIVEVFGVFLMNPNPKKMQNLPHIWAFFHLADIIT